ncbi:hypothetical protein NGUA18_04915 [Salmonella enterica]|nr:hypothetical protein NGUA18_04915 [Salmonella enterica]
MSKMINHIIHAINIEFIIGTTNLCIRGVTGYWESCRIQNIAHSNRTGILKITTSYIFPNVSTNNATHISDGMIHLPKSQPRFIE